MTTQRHRSLFLIALAIIGCVWLAVTCESAQAGCGDYVVFASAKQQSPWHGETLRTAWDHMVDTIPVPPMSDHQAPCHGLKCSRQAAPSLQLRVAVTPLEMLGPPRPFPFNELNNARQHSHDADDHASREMVSRLFRPPRS
ncbi:MAG: hypothetical protein RIS70_344 [Planctomycetota bacterium]|jgi:hypothetical protein